jgi:hypothetical protein
MDPTQEAAMRIVIGDVAWIFAAALVLMVFRKVIENIAMGVLWKSGMKMDDIYYISGRKARLVRITLTKTTFYMDDRHTQMIVPNEQLTQLVIERQLDEGPLKIESVRSERVPEEA